MPKLPEVAVAEDGGGKPLCVAVIGDIVQSRRVRGTDRQRLQALFRDALDRLNDGYGPSILARFVITTGDEFQGLLHDAAVVPDLVWDLERALLPARFRLGFGLGTLDTALAPDAVAMDGPVWHRAREAIRQAATERRRGGRFVGFGSDTDPVLDALAHLLELVRDRWTDRQREVVGWLRTGRVHEEVAGELGITRQAVTKHAGAAGWDAYKEGEAAWRHLLSRFSFGEGWRGASAAERDTEHAEGGARGDGASPDAASPAGRNSP